MPISRVVPKIPNTPMVDAKGNITPEWRVFFVNLLAVINEIRSAIP